MMAAYRNHFISLSEAKEIAGNDKTASMALWRLTKRGDLLRVKEGLFAAIPPELVGENFEVNRYALFDRVMKSEGGLAYHSALELHGAAYSSHNKLYYLTTRKVKPFEFQGILYRSVWAPDIFGMTAVWTDGVKVNVTDKERTFLDCLRRLDLSGGLEEYLKSVESFTILDKGRLIDYLDRFGESSLVQRTGLMLTTMEDRIKVSESLMKSLRSRVGGNPCYLVPGRKKAKSMLNKEWQVYVPINLGELMRNV
jgi:predicted transcriptional regulator of viral defense system